MIVVCERQNCCGCEACVNACPRGGLTMKPNREGFAYPYVEQRLCMKCGCCSRVCPVLHRPQTFPVLDAYGAKHKNNSVKLKSSSGGMFTALAEVILQENGVVFGAAFDKDWNVVHTCIDNLDDLDKLRRSKYVQSRIGKTYQQAKQFLDRGLKVLFTGTPCQIAGLRNYLGKEYENLLTADIICHGVNSPAVWQKFLAESTRKNKIIGVDFRHKRFGWASPFLKITYKDGSYLPYVPQVFSSLANIKNGYLVRHHYRLPFGVSNMYERPSCHNCHFKGVNNRMADFTMGDLWGNWPNVITSQDRKLGISALLVNTPKAQAFFEKISPSITAQKTDAQKIAHFNAALEKSTIAHPKRSEFFARYERENVSKLIRSLSGEKPLVIRVFTKIFRRTCQKIKSILD